MRHDNDRDSHGNATDWISCRTSAMFRRRIVSKICFFSCCDNTARLFNWTTLVSAACAKRGHTHATCPTVNRPLATTVKLRSYTARSTACDSAYIGSRNSGLVPSVDFGQYLHDMVALENEHGRYHV